MLVGEGINALLNDGLTGNTWYVGLVDGSTDVEVAFADTMASHAGWTELTSYSESVRQTWTPSAVSGQTASNSTVLTFTLSAASTIYGVFLTTNSTKGGSTGTLLAVLAFTEEAVKISGETIQITITANGAEIAAV